MRIPLETINEIANQVAAAGGDDALLYIEAMGEETDVYMVGDATSCLWGISRAICRISALTGMPYKAFLEMLEDMCKADVDGEVVVRGELVKGGN